ncbi:MAG TPA: magnesium transporter CorA family protein [Candidatus Paceibacterota bacterium]|nr:magnesium transporter CorA family protein [Candidatus Paceibacterota bacterium]
MIKHIKYKNINWIQVESPTKEEVASLAGAYDIHPVIVHELETPSERSKVDLYDNCMYLILHFPDHLLSFGGPSAGKDTQEVDFIVGKDFIITTHYESIGSIEEFAKIFEATAMLDRSRKEIHAGYLFFFILRHLYQSLEPGLHHINNELKKIEQRTFSGRENENIKALAQVNRILLDFRWSLKNHKNVLRSLETAGKEFFGEKFSYYLDAIIGDYEKVWNMLESSRENFIDLQKTNDSLLTIRSNEIMKNLTVMSFVTFPLALVAAIFGMNTEFTPITRHPYGFWIIIAMMLAMGIVMYGYFKHRRWM